MYDITERAAVPGAALGNAAWQWACMLRCAIPGIVQSFDPAAQTCVVQVAIQERVMLSSTNDPKDLTSYVPTSQTIKPLKDVPVVMPHAGGWSMTLPIQQGTECLLVFADMCIDGWWQSGNVSPQMDRRRHDLSDAFALFGPWSQPKRLANYSTRSMQLRSDDGTTVIDLAEGAVTVTAPVVTVNASSSFALTAPAMTASASGGTTQPMATKAFTDYFTNDILPFLISKGYTGANPPANATTTTLQAE